MPFGFHHRRIRRLRHEALESRQLLAVVDSLVITEIMYEPALTPEDEAAERRERDFEFIELQNVGDEPISLDGVEVLEGVEFTFGAMTLGPKEYVLIVNDIDTFEARYGAGLPIAGEYSGSLANGGDQLILQDSAGTVILDFEFDNAWYPSTDGGGHSLTIINPAASRDRWEVAAAWMPSSNMNGSPGVADPAEGFVVSDLAANLVSTRKIAVTWTAATAPPSEISEYRIYRNGQQVGSTTETTLVDTDVSPGNDYSYQVSVVNGTNMEFAQSFPVDVRVPAVGGDPTFVPGGSMRVHGLMEHGLLELSGLITSRRNEGVLWLHDDGAGNNDVHAISTRGDYLGVLQLQGVTSVDWEDIAAGIGPTPGANYLYIGDIGDNNRDRTSIQVYRVPEPTISVDQTDQTIVETDYTMLDLVYGDGESYDAEALFVDPQTGDLYVITKENNAAQFFRASAEQLTGTGTVTMSLAAEVEFDAVSAADISSAGDQIILRNEDQASLFVRGEGQSVAEALAGRPFDMPVIGTPDEPNGEAITFTIQGNAYFTISEGEEPPLYVFHRVGPALPGDANMDGRVDGADFSLWASHRDEADVLWSEGDFNGDGLADDADYEIWNANKFSVRSPDFVPNSQRTPRAPIASATPVHPPLPRRLENLLERRRSADVTPADHTPADLARQQHLDSVFAASESYRWTSWRWLGNRRNATTPKEEMGSGIANEQTPPSSPFIFFAMGQDAAVR